MKPSLAFLISTGLFLSACSPQQYQVNPPLPEQDYVPGSLPDLRPPPVGGRGAQTITEIPKESDEAGYMRIVGDL